jgi:hypothetical protein
MCSRYRVTTVMPGSKTSERVKSPSPTRSRALLLPSSFKACMTPKLNRICAKKMALGGSSPVSSSVAAVRADSSPRSPSRKGTLWVEYPCAAQLLDKPAPPLPGRRGISAAPQVCELGLALGNAVRWPPVSNFRPFPLPRQLTVTTRASVARYHCL